MVSTRKATEQELTREAGVPEELPPRQDEGETSSRGGGRHSRPQGTQAHQGLQEVDPPREPSLEARTAVELQDELQAKMELKATEPHAAH
eukprot:5800974-Ditylum_brightwellii.AAC.1